MGLPFSHSWCPFACIYNPDYESQAANYELVDPQDPSKGFATIQAMQYRYNDAHYFTDS
eukprot:COSAG03_NODE_10_length_23829_cov_21.731395_16_plen_59_part_00